MIKAVILGIALAASGTLPWAAAAGANLRYWTVVPWAVPPTALFLWLWWKFVKRHPASLRAHDVPDEVWGAAIVAGILGIGASLLILDIANRFVTLPAQPISPELTQVPATTFLPLMLMGSAVAGVVEEASIRGYMQGAIERRHGPVVAILVTSLLFWLLHFTHPGFVAMMPFYVAVGATYGTLAYLTNSILPGMILHAGGDAMGGLMVLAQGRSVSTQPIPVPIGGTSFDASFWIACVALLVVGAAAVWAFSGLAALVHSAHAS